MVAESGGSLAVEIEPTVQAEVQIESPKEDEKASPAETESEQVASSNEDHSEKSDKPKTNGYKRKLERAAAEIAELRAKLAANTPSSPDKPQEKPNPENYPTWQEYETAKDEWTLSKATEKAVETLDKRSQETRSKDEQKAKIDAYENKIEKARESYADYDEVTESYDGPMTVEMQQAMLDSDVGADIAYYLASNPEEAERIAGMTVLGMARAIGKIEAKIEGKKVEKAAVKTTKSPPPITPIRGSSKVADPHDRGYIEVA